MYRNIFIAFWPQTRLIYSTYVYVGGHPITIQGTNNMHRNTNHRVLCVCARCIRTSLKLSQPIAFSGQKERRSGWPPVKCIKNRAYYWVALLPIWFILCIYQKSIQFFSFLPHSCTVSKNMFLDSDCHYLCEIWGKIAYQTKIAVLNIIFSPHSSINAANKKL